MNLQEYTGFDATGLAELVRKGTIKPEELTDLARQACEKVNPQINAVIEFYDDAESASGPSEGPFAGVPFLRKDIGAGEANRLQEQGCRLLRGKIIDQDASYTRRAKAAGLRYVGRSTTPELGIAGMTQTIINGITRNPWNPDRTAGGSSGGAAAAVAAGIVPMAHASDGGGSTRIPASWCGLIGLNPSRGRISGSPDNQDALFGLAREFVVCRTVRDMAAMLDVLSGPEPGDPFIIRAPERPYREELQRPTGKLKIGVARTAWGEMPIDSQVLAEVDRIARQLGELGHDLEEIVSPIDAEEVMVGVMGSFIMALPRVRQIAQAMDREIGPDTLEPVTLKLLEFAENMRPADTSRVFEALRRIRVDVSAKLSMFDAVLTPSLPITAPEHGLFSTMNDALSAKEFMAADTKVFTFLGTFNVTGHPAVNLPTGLSSDGLPIGMQIVAPLADEALLVRLARDLEEANDWSRQIAPIHASR